MMSCIDITMTATLRASILEKTLSSFKENMFKDINCRLILNIDPVGEEGTVDKVVTTARKYFDCLLNIPQTPNFSRAFVWVLSRSTSKYVFHLEDDWELLRPVDLFDMLHIMEERPKLASLRLPYRVSLEQSKNWSTFYDFDGEIFMCPNEERLVQGFCGHPSLIRGDFIRECVKFINQNKNPEKQFHTWGPPQIVKEVLKYDYGVYQKQNEDMYIRDIGRKWLQGTPWQKKGIKAFFNTWEKIPKGA